MAGSRLFTLNSRSWSNSANIHCCGGAFFDGELRSGIDLCKLFTGVSTTSDLSDILESLNGYFAVIIETDARTLLAVDHVRSIPLFFATTSRDVYAGDDFLAIRAALSEQNLDQRSAAELSVAGYASGTHTLDEKVSKLVPGQIVALEHGARPDTTSTRYLRYRSETDAARTTSGPFDEMDDVMDNIANRLLEYANGRPIIVPLTAGYDSQLVALALKKAGCEDFYTVCHNIGSAGDQEISERVAADLSVPWEPITVTHESIRELYNSRKCKRLFRETGSYGRVSPPVSISATIDGLQTSSNLPDSGVIVPAHLAAAPGGFVPPWIYNVNSSFSRRAVFEGLFDYHYNLYRWNRTGELRDVIESRVRDAISVGDPLSRRDAISALETWYWQERTPNFLLADHLIYESLGYDRWLPLWDREYVDLISSLPLEQRYDKRLHKRYTEKLYREVTGTDRRAGKDVGNASPFRNRLANRISGTLVGDIAKRVQESVTAFRKRRNWEMEYDENERYGFLTKDEFESRYAGREQYKHLLAQELLREEYGIDLDWLNNKYLDG